MLLSDGGEGTDVNELELRIRHVATLPKLCGKGTLIVGPSLGLPISDEVAETMEAGRTAPGGRQPHARQNKKAGGW